MKDLENSDDFVPMYEYPKEKKGFFEWLKEGYDKIQKGLDTDKVIVITGKERKGKTTLALRIIYALNNIFMLDNIVFNGRCFRIRSKEVEKDILLLDEGGNSLYAADSMTTDSKKLVKRIMEMGSNNNLCFILIPDYFSLHKNIRERRVGGLIKITKLGRFKTYNEKKAIKIGKEKSWTNIKPDTQGYWNQDNTCEGFEKLWKDYKKKEKEWKNRKEEDEIMEDGGEPKTEWEIKLETAIKARKELGLTQQDAAKIAGVTRQTIAKYEKQIVTM